MQNTKLTLRKMICLCSALLALSTQSCTSRSEERFGQFLKFAEHRTKASSPERSLAESAAYPPGTCLKDQYSAHSLEREIKKLQKKPLSTQRWEQKKWNGIDLSTFSDEDTLFLRDYRQHFAESATQNSSCTSVACLINQIHQSPESLTGLSYIDWALRTGYPQNLSTEHFLTKLPDGIAPSDIQLKAPEWEAFWHLGQTLPSRFFQLPNIRAIYRMPAHTYYPGCSGAAACWSGWSHSGDVILMDGCMGIYSQPSNLHSFIYECVSHEFSHALDFHADVTTTRFSDSDRWKTLSGWHTVEVTETVTNAVTGKSEQKTALQWKFSEGAEFVSTYAQSSPSEDWADTLAYYRYSPDSVATQAPKKAALIRELIYQGRDFTLTGAGQYLLNLSVARGLSEIDQWVERCQSHTSTATPSEASASAPMFVLTQAPAILASCIHNEFRAFGEAEINRLKETEYEACGYFVQKQRIQDFFTALTPRFSEPLAQSLERSETMKSYLKAQAALRKELTEKIDPRGIYTFCRRSSSPGACYSEKLVQAFQAIFANYHSTLSDGQESELKLFTQAHSFEAAAQSAHASYRSLFDQSPVKWLDLVTQRIVSCRAKIGSQLEIPQFRTAPYSPGTQYVVSNLLQCINMNLLQDEYEAAQTLSAQFQRAMVAHELEYAESIAEEILIPLLHREILGEALGEKQKLELYLSAHLAEWKQSLDQKWTQSRLLLTETEGTQQCLPLARTIIQNDPITRTEQNPHYYISPEDLELQFAQSLCQAWIASVAPTLDNLRTLLAQNVRPGDVYRQCAQKTDAQNRPSCYAQTLEKSFRATLGSSLSSEQLEIEWKNYSSAHPLERTQLELYPLALSAIPKWSTKSEEIVNESLASCRESEWTLPRAIPDVVPFPEEENVTSGLSECSKKQLLARVSAESDRYGVEAALKDLVIPASREQLLAQTKKWIQLERARTEAIWNQVREGWREYLHTELEDQGYLDADRCRKDAQAKISDYLQRLKRVDEKSAIHLRTLHELEHTDIQLTCAALVADARLNQALLRLDELIHTRVGEAVQECRRKITKANTQDYNDLKIKRRACLQEQWGTPQSTLQSPSENTLAERIYSEWKSTLPPHEFDSSLGEAHEYTHSQMSQLREPSFRDVIVP